jgi:PAS domain S-box-containing protein
VFATDSISTHFPGAGSYQDSASGVLALRFSTSTKDFALWFRPEQIQIVNWAGDPRNPVDNSDNGQRIMPTTSFALWKEAVRGKSEPWLEVEVNAVSDLRRAILGAEIGLRALNAKLESLVEQRTASLREKEERLRLAQEAAHVASWEWDIAGNRLFGSAEFNEFYGLAPGESISYADWTERVVPEDRETLNAGLDRLRRGEVDCEAEFRVRHADGEIRWHLARGAGFGTADGRVERALGVSVDITDDKEAEAKLRASEALLRTFVRYVPAAVAMLDRHLRYLQVSERWSQDFGVESNQVLGRTVYDVFPYLPEYWKRAHQHCLSGESAFGEETAIGSPDGRRIWVRWEIRPFGDRTGEPQGILVFTEDITQRRQMERQLRMRTDALDNALTAFCLVASDGTITYANRTYVRLWGYENLSEIVGKPVEKYLADPGVAESIAAELARHDHCTIEFAARRKDGSTFYALSTIQSSIDSDSNRSYICAALDITDRKGVETALRESEATNRMLLETASQGIVAVSENGSIVIANRKAAELFGYEQQELLGNSISSLLPDCAAGQKALTMLESIGTELRVVHKNGAEFPIEISISHLETKNLSLAVAFITDISKRKQDEAALRSSQEELRRLAGSLLTAQEDERRRIARDLHDDVTQELALISIDIGTLAKALPDGDASIPALRSLQSRIGEVSSVVRHLSHGLHPSMLEALGLTAALEASCEEFSQIEGIPVEFDPEADEEQLGEAEAACLYRIAQESLRNIAKHAHASQVKIELTSDGNNMHLLVHDNGIGIASSRSEVRERAGLGLVAMKERIRLVNGTLSVASSPGEGTHIISSVPLEGTNRGTTAHSSR